MLDENEHIKSNMVYCPNCKNQFNKTQARCWYNLEKCDIECPACNSMIETTKLREYTKKRLNIIIKRRKKRRK